MSDRFTITPRWFPGMLRPWPHWCRKPSPSGMGGGCRFRYGHPFPHEDFTGRSWTDTPPAPDPALREWAYQKALGYKERKLNRQRAYAARLEAALAKQKAQTADDQRYIDALEVATAPATLAKIRADIQRTSGGAA